MGSLKVISYNVKGLLINHLKRNSCQTAFLQETHLSDKEHEKLKKSGADKDFIHHTHLAEKEVYLF